MLKRAWFVVAAGWAGCCLWGGISASRGLEGKDVLTAFAPLGVIWVARFVLFGLPSPRLRRR
jgi:hypothetical protein